MNESSSAVPLLQAFRAELAALVPEGAGLLLAVSGGSDSMALMCLAAAAAAEQGLRLGVGFVDHGLREGVDAEWTLVSERAGALGLIAERVALEPREHGERGAAREGSLQAWAREQRYRALAELARRQGAQFVATGHTMDDQAETVLLRLIRGTGIDGLGAIPRRRPCAGRELVRPLLGFARADLRRFLEQRGVSWIEDPSNRDPRFARVRVREELLPLFEELQPGAAGRIAALATEAHAAGRLIDETINAENLPINLRLGRGVKVDCNSFHGVPQPMWSRVVRHALERVRGDLRRLERAHVEPIVSLLAAGGSAGPLPLPGSAVAYAYRGSLYVFPAPLPPRPTGGGQPVAEGPGRWRARFAALGALAEIDAEEGIPVGDLELRARRPGDRLLGGDKKLKELFSARRIPRPYRDFVPLLALDEWIVASPGLVACRLGGVRVRWILDSVAPCLDIDFPLHM